MLELAADLLPRVRAGTALVSATVTAVAGSAPRRPGSSMVLDGSGAVLGNVSGGCVDSAVHHAAQQLLDDGGPAEVLRFGYADGDGFEVGLTCGGTVELLLRRHDPAGSPALEAALADAVHDRPVALVTVAAGALDAPDEERRSLLGRSVVRRPGRPLLGTLGDPALDRAAAAHADAALHAGRSGTVEVRGGDGPCADGTTLLVEVTTPAPRLLVVGAVDHAAALAAAGALLGYRVTVCDARATFATPERFPAASEVAVARPERYLAEQDLDGRAAVVVLSHDPKVDVPVLALALRLPVGYVGAMGSRRTHEERTARLRAAGVTDLELARLRSPVGLDLGARTPAEVALSVLAEIVADRHGATGAPLRTGLPVHPVHPLLKEPA